VSLQRSGAALAAGCLWFAASAVRAEEAVPDLSGLSIEELANVQVTSVLKRAEALGEAPSSVYVITHDDILRSGALTLPEVLRLAPNLEVAQTSSSRYVITARGLNGAPAAQNFANKLLVLIDGRSVYSPLYSGVYWDMQDVSLQDVDRIEVISGPGATLWGANAVNGVINIITRAAGETQGGAVRLAAGAEEGRASLSYGGRLSDTLSYRVYANGDWQGESRLASGVGANDDWSRGQGGFRLDWAASDRDALTLQGDLYDGSESQAGGAPPEDVRGGNVTARWTRQLGQGASLQMQAYYDRAQRSAEVDGSGFWVDTADLDVQASNDLGRHQLVYGGGYRAVRYRIDGTPTLFWVPNSRTLGLGDVFVQDTITLDPTLALTLGTKLEADPNLRPELLPSARLAWSPSPQLTLWGAVSRAIRSPTPFDREVVEKTAAGAPAFLQGDPDFKSEKLTAYELGVKGHLSDRASFVLTAYVHNYDDLRSIEVTPATFLPLRWGNGMRGRVYGLEAWGQYQAASWWRLSGSFTTLSESFGFQPGASGLLGPSQAANDPRRQAQLRSSMTWNAVRLESWLRYVSAAPDPRVPAYVELNAQLAWSLSDRLTLAIDGRNLLHEDHVEYAGGDRIPRRILAELQWRF